MLVQIKHTKVNVWRWPGKTRGAIGFALTFFVSFLGQAKKENNKHLMLKRKKYFCDDNQLSKKEFEKIINDFIDHTDYDVTEKEKAKDNAWFALQKGVPLQLGNHLLIIKK
jgi:hypothetical protein